MHPDQFIQGIASRLKLPKLEFNHEHVCRLVLDGRYVIDLECVDDARAIYIYSVVHPRASELQPRLNELLASNLFGRGTADATLAVDPERDEVLLMRRFELDGLDLDWFQRQLNRFAESVGSWTTKLDCPVLDAPEPTAAASDHHFVAGALKV